MKKDVLIPEEFFKMGDNFNAFIPDMEEALKESRRRKQEILLKKQNNSRFYSSQTKTPLSSTLK